MLSKEEQRFRKYWADQREGGKWSYLLIYTFCWTFITIVSPILLNLFFSVFSFFELHLWPAVAIIMAIALLYFVITHYFWERNERRWQLLQSKKEEI